MAVPPRMLSTALRRQGCKPPVAARARMPGSAWAGSARGSVRRVVGEHDHHDAERMRALRWPMTALARRGATAVKGRAIVADDYRRRHI